MCDPLTPMFPLFFMKNDKKGMLTLVRTLKAFKTSLSHLKTWYEKIENHSITIESRSFPDTKCIQNIYFHYIRRLDESKLIFLVQLLDGRKAVLKICESYSDSVHSFCYEQGFAPRLFGIEISLDGLYYVLMEYSESMITWNSFTGNRPEAFIEIQRGLNSLHAHGFVHGDFRPNNILVSTTIPHKIWFIDFDFSGKIEDATYPPFLNMIDIRWAEGVKYGMSLKPEHDLHWLRKMN